MPLTSPFSSDTGVAGALPSRDRIESPEGVRRQARPEAPSAATLKVLLFTNAFPSSREPTRGTFHRNLFGAVAKLCDVRLVAPVPWWSRARRPADWIRAPREIHGGIEAVYPTYWSIPGRTPMHGEAMYRSLHRGVAKLRKTFRFDAILSAWAYPDTYAAARLADEFDCPLITRVMGSDINDLATDPRLRPMIKWGLGRADTVLAVSGALKEKLVALGIPRERILMRHNGVDADKFSPRDRREARSRLGLPPERPIVCYVGNLKQEKGVDVLVDAFALLHRSMHGEPLLVLVGGGDQESPLRERAAALGPSDDVRFIGRRPHAEIPDWIGACDVFCLPSRREGCPNVVLEGLACGRPVVASAVGGVPELISAENGILVPSDDPPAMASALEQALSGEWDPEKLRGSASRQSWDDIAGTLFQRIEAAVAGHRAG